MKKQKDGNGYRIVVSLDDVRKLAAKLHSTGELASCLGISRATLERRLQEPEFQAAFEEGREAGCAKVRAKQLELALAGNPTMLIWLGKQYLGQRDTIDQNFGAAGGGKLQIEIVRVSVAQPEEPAAIEGTKSVVIDIPKADK